CSTHVPPPVDEKRWHLLVGKAERMQHDRPINAVSWNENVFANNVQRWPFFAEFVRLIRELLLRRVVADKADVIRQGIEPDKVHIFPVEGQLDSPAQTRFRSGNAKVST